MRSKLLSEHGVEQVKFQCLQIVDKQWYCLKKVCKPIFFLSLYLKTIKKKKQ